MLLLKLGVLLSIALLPSCFMAALLPTKRLFVLLPHAGGCGAH
jgi:hypothetical protein